MNIKIVKSELRSLHNYIAIYTPPKPKRKKQYGFGDTEIEAITNVKNKIKKGS